MRGTAKATTCHLQLVLLTGLFSFLKSRKDPANAGVELENLQKQVANLISAGRTDDAKNAVLFFLDKYARETGNAGTSASDLARISYFLAYLALPDLIYSRWGEFSRLWNGLVPFHMYLAIKGASDQGEPFSLEQINAFKCYQGVLTPDVDYYLIEFPAPPSVIAQLAQGEKVSRDALPVLGPHFAAALLNKKIDEKQLYVLGEAVQGAMTLRTVTAKGENCNCGPGPEPRLDSFLQAHATQI